MEPTEDGKKKESPTWKWIKKFYDRHDEAIMCIAIGCVVEVVMIHQVIRQTEARVKDDWWVWAVDDRMPDSDGRDRIYVHHNNGQVHTFSRPHEPEPLMDQVFGKQKN